jgi:streptogramin lyase
MMRLNILRWPVAAVGLAAALTIGASAAVSDSVEVKFDDWMTPSVRPFPHDPAAGRDGSVWYTAQLSNAVGGLVEDSEGDIWYTGNAAGLIGKINPETGEVTEYKMPDVGRGDLVLRNRRSRAEHTCAVQSRDEQDAVVADSGRRRRRAQHGRLEGTERRGVVAG